jgi:hypothetical protein
MVQVHGAWDFFVYWAKSTSPGDFTITTQIAGFHQNLAMLCEK